MLVSQKISPLKPTSDFIKLASAEILISKPLPTLTGLSTDFTDVTFSDLLGFCARPTTVGTEQGLAERIIPR